MIEFFHIRFIISRIFANFAYMKHVKVDSSIDIFHRRLPFFLALEEWVARRLPAGDYFFSWQVDPTVICGRNQEIDKEVNLDYCAREGIDVVRRRSGGGAVFADRQNFMFSFITPSDRVTETFAAYTAMIAEQLRRLNLDAEATGRNDITVAGKKISGNAFYHLPGRSIAHGTMLYDFDATRLAGALTPSKAKLESKGVKSVPARVTCLKQEGIALSPEEFEQFIIDGITDGEPYILSASDVREVEQIELTYYDPSFMRIVNNRSASSPTHRRSIQRHIDGVGEICLEYDDLDSVIANCHISGDFFMTDDAATFAASLNGLDISDPHLEEKLLSLHPESFIHGLTAPLFLTLIRPS